MLSKPGDGDNLLDNNAWMASVLSLKLVCMAGGADLDGPKPGGATSPAGSASSAVSASQMARVRWALMIETLTVVAVQMMKAPAATSQAVKKHQMMRVPSRMVQTMKARGLTVRWCYVLPGRAPMLCIFPRVLFPNMI